MLLAKKELILSQVTHRCHVAGLPGGLSRSVHLHRTITDCIEVWEVHDLFADARTDSYGPILYALVVFKSEGPVGTWRVVDFHVGSDPYGNVAAGEK